MIKVINLYTIEALICRNLFFMDKKGYQQNSHE